MDEVILSVSITTYNHEKYIAEAIESILSQKTQYKYEILIGEDCSTDSTREIVRRYQKEYPGIIRVFCSRRNVGGSKNGYYLLTKARGKYVATCDGDDYWCDTGRIQRDVDFLETHREYMGVSNRCIVVDEDGNRVPEKQVGDSFTFWNFGKREYTLKDFEDWRMPGHISGLTTRNLYQMYGQDASIFYKAARNVGDRVYVMLTVLQGDIYCLPNQTSCYRFRVSETGKNFMSEYRNKNLRDEDFLMIRKLEQWTLANRDVELDLGRVKKDRLAGSIVVFMRNPTKYNLKVVFRIILYSGEPIKYLYYSLKVWVLKMYYWYVKKTDRMILL